MNRKLRRGLLQEIAERLVQDIETEPPFEVPEPASTVDVLLQQLTTSVVGLLREASSRQSATDPALEARLQKAERRLSELASVDRDDADDDDDDAEDGPDNLWSSFPNLKYAKPKYKDVESVLKYIESEDGRGEIKLVIMNFND